MPGKRGATELVMENLIFIILNIAFFASLLVFVVNSSSGNYAYEQLYAKKIAFMIDMARPGTNITLRLDELFRRASKNGFSGNVVSIDPKTNAVLVKVSERSGYEMRHFNPNAIVWKLDKENKALFLEIK